MTFISEKLGPYKDVIGTTASFLTILQFFAGLTTCREIRRNENTHGISAVPFIGGIMVGLVMFKYGLLVDDATTLTVNFVATLLNMLYCAYYLFYCQNKFNAVFKPLMVGMLIVVVMWVYGDLEDPEKVAFRYGVMATVLMLLVMASPLLNVKEMVAKKDASEIPFGMTVMTTMITLLWVVYALTIVNNFMLLQNLFGLILCATQLFLILKYPGTKND